MFFLFVFIFYYKSTIFVVVVFILLTTAAVCVMAYSKFVIIGCKQKAAHFKVHADTF